MTFHEFLLMGGYGLYVWSSWGICLVVAAVFWVAAKRRERRIRTKLMIQLRRQEKFNQ